jgi:hypothetical protein
MGISVFTINLSGIGVGWSERIMRTVVPLPTQAALMRCIVGNPFRPVPPEPAWLIWNGGTVRTLAEAIYAERAFERTSILADALEDAGCADEQILSHCRGDGAHVRGCWIVDLFTGRG